MSQKRSHRLTACSFVKSYNLTDFQFFLHCWKAYEICYKTHMALPTSPRYVVTLPWEIKEVKFSPDVEENANRLHFLIACNFITHPQILIFSVFKIASLSPYWLPAAFRAAQAAGIWFTQMPILRIFLPRRRDTLHRRGWNLARRRAPSVPYRVRNLTPIGATCRPCGAKNLKIGLWVNQIPAACAARNAAGKH